MNSIAFAVIVLVVLGLAGGIILVLASKFMAVYEDPRIAQITECLAGANCGGCGYAGCADYAKAIGQWQQQRHRWECRGIQSGCHSCRCRRCSLQQRAGPGRWRSQCP